METSKPVDIRERIHRLIAHMPAPKLEQLLEQLERENAGNYGVSELLVELEEDRELLKRLAQ